MRQSRLNVSCHQRASRLWSFMGAISLLCVGMHWTAFGGTCDLVTPEVSPSTAVNTNAALDGSLDDRAVSVVASPTGTCVAAWQTAGAFGSDPDIIFARSTDAGVHWTNPQPLNSNAMADSAGDAIVRLATDGKGVWIAVWRSNDSLGGTIGTDEDIFFSRSVDDGESWSTLGVVNSEAAVDNHADSAARIATDGKGTWLVVWVSSHDLGGTIGTDNDIMFSRSIDNGLTWTVQAPVNANAASDSGDDRTPCIATGNGDWLVGWNSDDSLGGTVGTDQDIVMARSSDAGANWSAPQPVNTDAGTDNITDRNPVIATNGKGGWMVAWERNYRLENDVLFARSQDAGETWTNWAHVNNNGAVDTGHDLEPFIACDDSGTWIIVWRSEDSFGNSVGFDQDIIVAFSTTFGASWTDPAAGNDAAGDGQAVDTTPSATFVGQGEWLLAWSSENTLNGSIGSDFDILRSCIHVHIEQDCNANGIGDACDIAGGTSSDANLNGIPDECDPPQTQPASLARVVSEGDEVPGAGGIQYVWTAICNGSTDAAFLYDLAPSGRGIAFASNAGVVPVAHSEQQAPGTAIGVTFPVTNPFESYSMSTGGHVILAANLIGTGVDQSNDKGIWLWSSSGAQLVVREGDHAAGTSLSTVFQAMSNSTTGIMDPQINEAGTVTYRGLLTGPDVTVDNNMGVWSWSNGTHTLIAREGDLAPDTTVSFVSFESPLIDSAGNIVFRAGLDGISGSDGIWRYDANGSMGKAIALVGEQVPALPTGVVFGGFSDLLVSANGAIHFRATLTGPGITTSNNFGIWKYAESRLDLLVRKGDPAPGFLLGGTFFNLQAASVSANGRLAFIATVSNGDNGDGLWTELSSGFSLVAREGNQAPGAPAGQVFQNFIQSANPLSVAINDHGDVVFQHKLALEAGVWGWRDGVGLFHAAAPGGVVDIANEKMQTVNSANLSAHHAGNSGLWSKSLTNDRQFIFRIRFQPVMTTAILLGDMPLPGDLNADGEVNIDDLLIVIASWGICACFECEGDANDSGAVDINDLLIVISNWG